MVDDLQDFKKNTDYYRINGNLSYNSFISRNINKKLINYSLIFSKVLCVIIFIIACLNFLRFGLISSDLFNGFINIFDFKSLFYIFVSLDVIILFSSYSNKLRSFSFLLNLITFVYAILSLLSSFNLFGLANVGLLFSTDIIVPFIFLGFSIILFAFQFEKYLDFAQILSIIFLIIGFSGFLYYMGTPTITSYIKSFSYLIFDMGMGIVLLTSYPYGKYMNALFLDISGSKLARLLIVIAPMFLVIFTSLMIYLDGIITLPLKRGVIIAVAVMVFLISLMLFYSWKLSWADYHKLKSKNYTHETETFFEGILDTIVEGFMVTNKNGEIIYINNLMKDYFNIDDSIIGKSYKDMHIEFFVSNEYYMEVKSSLEPIFLDSRQILNSTKNKFLSGWIIPRVINDEFVGCIFSAIDVTKNKLFTQNLENESEEQDLLLTEIHHRVKNNMQVIMSLLNLQSHNIGGDEIKSILMDISARIKTMALVHETLYQNLDFANIVISDYIENLVEQLKSHFYGRDVNFVLDLDFALLNLDHVIPIGLIINELVTNSMVHGFLDEDNIDSMDDKTINITFNKVGESCTLIVKDNGVGYSEDSTEGIGTQLLNALITEIEGSSEIKCDNGVCVCIKFNYFD